MRKVFLSSTARDLQKYRDAVFDAIQKCDDLHCVRMEDFGARAKMTDEFCRAKVVECDVFVGIIGHYFGSSPEGSTKSYTQQEYGASVETNKPRLMFIAPDDFPIPANLIEDEWKRESQRAFRKRVNGEPRAEFKSPEDLTTKIVTAIRNWEREQEQFCREQLREPDPAYIIGGGEKISPIGLDSIGSDVSRYKSRFAEKIENDAARQKHLLGTEDYIKNYLPLNATLYQGPIPNSSNLATQEDLFKLLRGCMYERILILGEAGSGKTASLKRFSCELAQNDPLAVPILVSLQDCREEGVIPDVINELKKYGTFSFLNNEQDLQRLFTDLGSHYRFYLFLDGLNEILPSRREGVLKNLDGFLLKCPVYSVVLTCRIQDDAQFVDILGRIDTNLVLQPLTEEQVSDCLPGLSSDQDLYAVRIRKLAANPSILALIKNRLIAQSSITNQSEVFTNFVRQELVRDRKKNIGLNIDDESKVNGLAYLAFTLNQQHKTIIERGEAISALLKRFGEEKSSPIVDSALSHGLLIEEQDKEYVRKLSFAPNLMMQEYFAAIELRKILAEESEEPTSRDILKIIKALFRDPSQLASFARDPWWIETFILLYGLLIDSTEIKEIRMPPSWLIGKLALAWNVPWLAWWCYEQQISGRDEKLEAVVRQAAADHLADPDKDVRYKAVGTLLAFTPRGYSRAKYSLLPRTAELLIKAVGDEEPHVAKRALEGLLELHEYRTDLGKNAMELIGRHPDESAVRGARRIMLAFKKEPVTDFPLKMIYIPSGPFIMGSNEDGEASINEPTRHAIVLPEYWLSQYPLRNKDYALFVRSARYSPPGHWKGDAFLEGKDEHPVTEVSWYDACAYCEWLTKTTGYPVRLPTEAEWEKGARGTDGRRFPWGEEKPNSEYCNYNSSGTAPVGIYPLDRSPYGCHDMAGNVNEWCLQQKSLRFAQKRMPLRGASFNDGAHAIRCSWRREIEPEKTEAHIGFRVVISLIEPVRLLKTSLGYKVQW